MFKRIPAKLIMPKQILVTEYGEFEIETVYTDGNGDINIMLKSPWHTLEKQVFEELNLHLPIIRNPETLVRIKEKNHELL